MLYKYFPFERESFLHDRLLRFTQPSAFNDPFELNPCFELISKEELAALPVAPDGKGRILTRSAMQKMLAPILAGLQSEAAQYANHDGAFALDNNRIAQSTFDAKFGILCLSECPDSVLMWAHYANNYRGFVVQFDDTHPFFEGTPFEDQTLALKKVEYSLERPVLSPGTLSSPHLYYRKSTAWSYEREWRLVRPLSSASRILDRSPFPVHLHEVPREAIRGVIIGCGLSREEIVRLQDILGQSLNHASIFHIGLSKTTYSLEISPPLDGYASDAIDGTALYAQ